MRQRGLTSSRLADRVVARRGGVLALCVGAAVVLFSKPMAGQATRPSPVWNDVFESYVRARQPDSALRVLHRAVADGDSAVRVTRFALHEGNEWYKRGIAIKNIDTLTVAIRYLAYADSLVPSDPARYLIVAARIWIGTVAEHRAAETKSCRLAKLAQSNWKQALAGFRTTERDGPPEDPGVGVVIKSMPKVEHQVAAFCK